jgi:hypothetical protein
MDCQDCRKTCGILLTLRCDTFTWFVEKAFFWTHNFILTVIWNTHKGRTVRIMDTLYLAKPLWLSQSWTPSFFKGRLAKLGVALFQAFYPACFENQNVVPPTPFPADCISYYTGTDVTGSPLVCKLNRVALWGAQRVDCTYMNYCK